MIKPYLRSVSQSVQQKQRYCSGEQYGKTIYGQHGKDLECLDEVLEQLRDVRESLKDLERRNVNGIVM